jgi:hypothetical protein
VVVAFEVDGVSTSGVMAEASGLAEAPELVTAWHPPVVPWQVPVPWDPRGSGDSDGSVPVAELVTLPVQSAVVQLRAAPEAEAADGPDCPDPLWLVWSLVARYWAAPGWVEATDTVCGVQAPPPAVQDAVPAVVRGPPAVGS